MEKNGKVLVIEDKEIWQNKLRQYLEAGGFAVDIVGDLNTALKKVVDERYHFITLDMQLNEDTTTPQQYEGWSMLEIINRLRIQEITPVMVITAFGENYMKFKSEKKVESLFFMKKSEFDRQKFLQIVNEQIKRIDLRFKDDNRGD